jgi:hypothetical protein
LSDLPSVLIAVPFAIFFFGFIVAFICGFDCLWEAAKHTTIPEEKMPFMLRYSRTNILWYPKALDTTGLEIRRKAIRWYAVGLALLIGLVVYVGWIRGIQG